MGMVSSKNEVFEYLIDQLRQQLTNNPYKQQCEDLAHEVLSLKNQFPDYVECANCGSVTHVGGVQ